MSVGFMPGKTVRTKAESYVVVAVHSDGGTFMPREGRSSSRENADAFAQTLFENHKCVEVRQRIDVTLYSGIPHNRRAKVLTYPILDSWAEWETVTSLTSF